MTPPTPPKKPSTAEPAERLAVRINRDHLETARGFFEIAPGPYGDRPTISTRFHRAAATVCAHAVASRALGDTSDEACKLRTLARFFNYTAQRLIEPLGHLRLLDWLMGSFKDSSDPEAEGWRFVVELVIKDFHNSLNSLLDSIAPLAISAESAVKSKDDARLPGFADIQQGTKRTYRDDMSIELLDIIDSSEVWWPAIKLVRNTLLHREHTILVFGTPAEDVRFNLMVTPPHVYLDLPDLASREHPELVHFRKYAAWALAEVLVLIDKLGEHIIRTLGIAEADLLGSSLEHGVPTLLTSLDAMLDSTRASLSSPEA